MKICGVSIKPSEIESVTFKRDGNTITISAKEPAGTTVQGFAGGKPPKATTK